MLNIVIPPNSNTFSNHINFVAEFVTCYKSKLTNSLGKQQLELPTRTWSGCAPWNCGKVVSHLASNKWFFHSFFFHFWVRGYNKTLRACSHGSGGPQAGEVPLFGGVTNLSIQSLLFSWLLSHESWSTSSRRVARLAVPGNPLRWGKFSPCECWRWGGVMFSWAFIHYKTNWNADRTAYNC